MTTPTPTHVLPELATATTAGDVQAAIDAGTQLAGPRPIHPGNDRFHTQIVPKGARLEHIDIDVLEQVNAHYPRRKTGTVHVQEAGSFLDYLAKHALPETEVWADPARKVLVGVINTHNASEGESEGLAGHGDHRVSLELIHTDAWKAWVGGDKQWMSQQAFAEHLEDHALDIVAPDAATMLEIAESFQASLGADFKSAQRLHDGLINFRYEETASAKAGHTGDLEIPKEFTLALAPFHGSDVHEVTARFRYRITNNALTLSYALRNPEEIARDAFEEQVGIVKDTHSGPVFRGRPE